MLTDADLQRFDAFYFKGGALSFTGGAFVSKQIVTYN